MSSFNSIAACVCSAPSLCTCSRYDLVTGACIELDTSKRIRGEGPPIVTSPVVDRLIIELPAMVDLSFIWRVRELSPSIGTRSLLLACSIVWLITIQPANSQFSYTRSSKLSISMEILYPACNRHRRDGVRDTYMVHFLLFLFLLRLLCERFVDGWSASISDSFRRGGWARLRGEDGMRKGEPATPGM